MLLQLYVKNLRLPSNSRNNGTHVRGSFDDMSRSEMDNPAFE